MKKESNIVIDKSSPAALATWLTKGKYKTPRHIGEIDKILVNASKRKQKRVIVNMPPRHGKSELISKYFPFWYLGTFPEQRIILTSYEARFAASWGRKVRSLLKEYGEKVFDIKLDPKSSSAERFDLLEHTGGMSTAGAGGPITGMGADLLLIDDPVKNDKEANSELMRDNVWEWFISTAYTRLEPDGIIIIIMTRWHEDDLCGRLIQLNKKEDDLDCEEIENDKWNILSLPAIAEENDYLGRKPGEALWEMRFPVQKLNAVRNTIGSYWFSALYQQSPTPKGAGIFKRINFKYFSQDANFYYLKNRSTDSIPQKIVKIEDCSVFAIMDLAVSKKETADYTVILVFCIAPDNKILILNVERVHIEGAQHINMIQDTFERWRPGTIGIESGQYQTTLVQIASSKGLPVKPIMPDNKKLTRALPIAARVECGDVYFKEDAFWLTAFEEELLSFPNGRHDDQVDAFAYIANLIYSVSDAVPAGAKRKGNGKGRLSGIDY
ncbi:MAG: phage terminase large subunit [FCB group bacterium]|jgi:predicted phage terminase large subunit-like protein